MTLKQYLEKAWKPEVEEADAMDVILGSVLLGGIGALILFGILSVIGCVFRGDFSEPPLWALIVPLTLWGALFIGVAIPEAILHARDTRIANKWKRRMRIIEEAKALIRKIDDQWLTKKEKETT